MRNMSRKEIVSFIGEWTWGTLIGVEEDKPYAIEVSYGTDGNYIYCGSKPGGRMWQCIEKNKNVVFKICDTDRHCNIWHAVIVEGVAEPRTTEEEILHCCQIIATQMGLRKDAFDKMAKKVAQNPKHNSLRIPLVNISGIAIGC